MKDKATKADNVLELEDGKPMVFGDGEKGIRLNGATPEVVSLTNVPVDDLLFHNETLPDPQLAFLLSRLRHPEFPEPIGVFRDVLRPTYDEEINRQVAEVKEQKGEGTLKDLFVSGDTWTVE